MPDAPYLSLLPAEPDPSDPDAPHLVTVSVKRDTHWCEVGPHAGQRVTGELRVETYSDRSMRFIWTGDGEAPRAVTFPRGTPVDEAQDAVDALKWGSRTDRRALSQADPGITVSPGSGVSRGPGGRGPRNSAFWTAIQMFQKRNTG